MSPRAERPFLTARWTNLALITYAVPTPVVAPFVPPGCTPELHEGSAHVSLVAFDFEETRVLGIAWPGYVRFPEINLRLYVRRGEERGVVFVREFVPRRLICLIARWRYNEPYRAARMSSRVDDAPHERTVFHTLHAGGRVNTLCIVGEKPAMLPRADSTEHFFKEHRWGFGVCRNGQLARYEVIHPVWAVLPVRSYRLDWDFGSVYGETWRFLNGRKPVSVILSEGSRVEVLPRRVMPAS